VRSSVKANRPLALAFGGCILILLLFPFGTLGSGSSVSCLLGFPFPWLAVTLNVSAYAGRPGHSNVCSLGVVWQGLVPEAILCLAIVSVGRLLNRLVSNRGIG